jgi:hypothetical protein
VKIPATYCTDLRHKKTNNDKNSVKKPFFLLPERPLFVTSNIYSPCQALALFLGLGQRSKCFISRRNFVTKTIFFPTYFVNIFSNFALTLFTPGCRKSLDVCPTQGFYDCFLVRIVWG